MSTIVATIGLMSSGPIRGTQARKRFRYGFVESSMKPIIARSVVLYGIGRNCWTQLSTTLAMIRTR